MLACGTEPRLPWPCADWLHCCRSGTGGRGELVPHGKGKRVDNFKFRPGGSLPKRLWLPAAPPGAGSDGASVMCARLFVHASHRETLPYALLVFWKFLTYCQQVFARTSHVPTACMGPAAFPRACQAWPAVPPASGPTCTRAPKFLNHGRACAQPEGGPRRG